MDEEGRGFEPLRWLIQDVRLFFCGVENSVEDRMEECRLEFAVFEMEIEWKNFNWNLRSSRNF